MAGLKKNTIKLLMLLSLLVLMGSDVECEQDYGDFYDGWGGYFYDDYDDDYYYDDYYYDDYYYDDYCW